MPSDKPRWKVRPKPVDYRAAEAEARARKAEAEVAALTHRVQVLEAQLDTLRDLAQHANDEGQPG